ncbi:MAG: hypothetical protein RR552_06105, partial [Oscillospiraceae bacterium]
TVEESVQSNETLDSTAKKNDKVTTTKKKVPTKGTTKKADANTNNNVNSPEVTVVVTKENNMKVSLDKDNKFIKLVAERYDIDPLLLAVLYDGDGGDENTVWQFSGERDKNGKLLRSSRTLKFVYTVKQNGAMQRTNGADINEGLSKSDGKMVFELTKRILLPIYKKQLV